MKRIGRNKGNISVIIRPGKFDEQKKTYPKVNKEGKTSVYVRYSYDSKHKLFATGVMVKPDEFKKDFCHPYVPVYKGLEDENYTIDAIERKVKDAVKSLKDKGTLPTIDMVDISEKLKNESYLFFETLKNYIDNIPIKENRSHEDKYARDQQTINNYNSLISNLEDFFNDDKKYKKDNLFLYQIDIKFYKAFKAYLSEKKKHKINTVGTRIKCLKSLLRELKDEGYTINADLSKFKISRSRKTKYFVKIIELEKLYKHDFGKHKAVLDKYVDVFAFQCNTGLRISDIKEFDASKHIKGGTIQMKAYKTLTNLHVPLTPKAYEILKKYSPDGDITKSKLPVKSDKNYEVLLNRYIKKAFKLAELDRIIETELAKGHTEEKPLHELVTSHLGVKSFITHCFEKGIPPADIAMMTGKDLKTIMNHYYSADASDVTTRMQQAWGMPEELMKVS